MEADSIFVNFLYYLCYITNREARLKLVQLSHTFKVIAVIGPRQAGKTTLLKITFPDNPY